MILVELIHAISRDMYRHADQLLQERLGIGMSQYRILALLHDHEVGLRQRAIAYALHQTEASISRQVCLLRGKLMIEQSTNPKSRREHIVTLTPKGVRLVAAAEEVLAIYTSTVFGEFGKKEQSRLVEILERLRAKLA